MVQQPQTNRDFHTFEYTIPLTDWEVKPPVQGWPAEMAYYPHSNRLYFRWRERLSNPISKVIAPHDPHGTHWGITELHSETTFYVRGIPEDRLPPPYKYVSCGLEYGKAGGPSSDDPLGEHPFYDVINVKRYAYGPN